MKQAKIRVGLVQHHYSHDAEYNRNRNYTAIETLAAMGADLVVLSELHDTTYF